MEIPFWMTALPACTLITPPLLLVWAESSKVPPLAARKVPALTRLPPLPGGTMCKVPPATSAKIKPLFTSKLLPPTKAAWPMLPRPRTVRPAPKVVVPEPSSDKRALGPLRLMKPVPSSDCAAPPADAASSAKMAPLATLMWPLFVMLGPCKRR
jgi:hypothetical protein